MADALTQIIETLTRVQQQLFPYQDGEHWIDLRNPGRSAREIRAEWVSARKAEIRDAIAAVRSLQSAAQADALDAKRYRWLREQPNDTTAPRIDVVYWTAEDESTNGGEGLRTEKLDAAIDAAIAVQEKT